MKDLRDVIAVLQKLEGVDGVAEMVAIINKERDSFKGAEAEARTAKKRADELQAKIEELEKTPPADQTEVQRLQASIEAMKTTLEERENALKAKEKEEIDGKNIKTVADALIGAGMSAKSAEKLARADYVTQAFTVDENGICCGGKYLSPSEFAENYKTDAPDLFGSAGGHDTNRGTPTRSAEPSLENLSASDLFAMANN